MDFNTFRRGGLFDPIMFDSGRSLAQSTGGFFGGFGDTIMNASSPADWEKIASQKMSQGDMEGAAAAMDRAKAMMQEYSAKADQRKLQRAALNQMHRDNDVALAESIGDQKAAALAKKVKAENRAKIDNIAKLAEKRMGSDIAAMIREIDDPAEAIKVVQAGIKDDKLVRESIVNPDTGDTERVVTNEKGEVVARIGVTKQAKKTSDSDTALESAKSALEAAREVLADKKGLEAWSGLSGSFPTLKPSTKAFEAKIDQLTGLLTLDNVDMLTGILSDSDMRLLANAASKLREGASLEHNEKEIKRIIEKLESGIANPLSNLSDEELLNAI